MSGYQRLALIAGIATYLLIVVGATVRVTGSGLGCPDWPLCHGSLLPPLEITALIEYSHRFVAALDTALIVAVVAGAWLVRRKEPSVVISASLMPVLLAVQIVLGAVTVLLELPPTIVLVHMAAALLILALLVWLTTAAGPPPQVRAAVSAIRPEGAPSNEFIKLCLATTAALFGLLMTGAYVQATAATWACAGFPLCNGEVLPLGVNQFINIHLLHRFTAYSVAILLLVNAVKAWQMRYSVPVMGWAAGAVVVSVLIQLAIGAIAVSIGVPPLLRGLHVAGATAVWASIVALTALAIRSRSGALGAPSPNIAPQQPQRAPGSASGGTITAYFQLTKPSIISLLLITTLASMMVAAEGFPPLPLVFFTLLGGALSAGAANTFNCYLDRDIDQLMGRTSRRPIPSGVIRPRQALAFGFALAALSLLVLGLFANWLAAVLSLAGLLYYVLVYTCWLKRSTPSNIVIGGAAGAVPPLVGWAAVTGEVSLLAVYLFAIIFFWTPPHFWALALLIRREYERARIPMLPIVRGDAETRQQILFYSIFLVAFTLVVVAFRQMGVFYLTAALVLGGVFLYHAARLLREANALAARRLFRYSILYLALLFAAMVIDRWRLP